MPRVGAARNLLAVAVLAGGLGLAATAAAQERLPGEALDPRVGTTARFTFWSHPTLNLHHFLYQWAAADLTEAGLRPLSVPERESLDRLDEEDRGEWLAAVAFYREHLAERSLVFDAGLIALRDELAGLGGVGPVGGLRGPLAEAVAVAAGVEPLYRRVWWPQHDAANRAWIDSVVPTLRTTEQDLASRLAVALGGRWPDGPVRVDVAAYAGRVGAYTAGPHITISSRDPGYAMPWALEMLFHEASHIASLESSLETAIEEAFREQGLRAPPGLDHVAIFETAGELARRAWATRGDRSYQPYAEHEGLFERNQVWGVYHRALAPSWREFLRGSLTRREALLNTVAALRGAS